VATRGQCEYNNTSWCNKSHKLQPSGLILNIWPELHSFHWTACLLSEVLEWDLAEGDGLTFLMSLPRWHRVIILWRIDISRCLETRNLLKTKGKLLAIIKVLLSSISLLRLIGPGSRTIIICRAAHARGSTTKSQLRRSNGTDEQRFGCYANIRRAHVLGSTTPRVSYARPSGYSLLSEVASALPAAHDSEQ
jgi:hypothetical protein